MELEQTKNFVKLLKTLEEENKGGTIDWDGNLLLEGYAVGMHAKDCLIIEEWDDEKAMLWSLETRRRFGTDVYIGVWRDVDSNKIVISPTLNLKILHEDPIPEIVLRTAKYYKQRYVYDISNRKLIAVNGTPVNA